MTPIFRGACKCPINDGILKSVFIFKCGLFSKMICKFPATETMDKIARIKDRKMSISSTVLIRLKFQGLRCESGRSLFKWSVT